MTDKMRLIDVGQYPEIHADGIGEVHFLQYTTRIVLFAWCKIDGVYRRAIAGTVVRPKDSFTPEQFDGLRSGLEAPPWHPERDLPHPHFLQMRMRPPPRTH